MTPRSMSAWAALPCTSLNVRPSLLRYFSALRDRSPTCSGMASRSEADCAYFAACSPAHQPSTMHQERLRLGEIFMPSLLAPAAKSPGSDVSNFSLTTAPPPWLDP